MAESELMHTACADDGLAPVPACAPTLVPDEVLYKNERTLILRRRLPHGGSVIVKRALGTDALARLRHEEGILRRLDHIAGVVHLAPEQASGTLSLQDNAAISLSQVIKTERLSVTAIIELATLLAQTLSAVHRAGVIHKDINPSNILLTGAERRPVLIDFNIASCFAQEKPAFMHQSDIAGTLAYMAPEQTGRTGRVVDQRSDLYAVGVTLYELATGRKPFESDDLLEMIHDHLVRTAATPISLNSALPQGLSDIIVRLLEKEADRRYQSAEGLARDLARLQERLSAGLPPTFALGLDDFALRLTPPSTLVGRKDEVATLQSAIDRAARGEGRALLVAGAPGVGKSALINELQPMVTGRRGWFVQGKFEQYQREGASAVVQALRALGRLLLAEPEAALVRHRACILQALGANAGLGPSRLPEFALLLGKLPKVMVDDPVEAEARMLQATIDLLKSVVSPEQPLVMVVDDLQWAPAISLRFIDALMTQGRSLQGLLLVGAYRDAEVDAAHPLSAMLTRWDELGVAPPIMRLGNLPTGDVGALIAEMLRLPQRESARLGTALIERTDGNPYDTVELINALRQDGLLAPHDGQWQWDEAAIRQYVGDCDVVGLLSRRIDRLPAASQQVLGQLACLGGEVSMALLEVGSGLNTDALEALLAPALEDGLIVAHSGHEREIRFRHDRVQQAMHERMNGAAQLGEHLAMARRLSAQPTLSALAARQYLPAFDAVTDPEECRNVIGQFLGSALLNKVVNFELSERFLSAAITLSGRLDMDASDQACLFMLQGERHAALVGLGRLDEADAVYEAIAAAQPDPLDLVDMAAVQIASLGNRQRNKEAMALGLGLLDALGFPHPESVETAIGMALFKLATWVGSPEMAADLARPELSDPRLLAVAKLLSKTQVAAFFCAAKTSAWLTLLGQSLWVEHGPCPTLMATMCASPVLLIATAEDYDSAYKLGQHLLAVGEQRRYEPATSVARFMFAMSTGHWREPVEDIVAHYRKAREGLFQAGDLQYGIFTYSAWTNLFDTLPTIEAGIEENDGAFTVSARTGDKNFLYIHGASRQLHKTLRGLIPADQPWGSFSDDSFDEAAHAASLTKPSIAGAYYHVERALSAAIFDDAAALHHHALAAMPLLYRIPGYYIVAQAHVLNALALANALRTLPAQATATDTPEPTPTGAEANHSEDRAKLLATLDKSLKWLKRRAKDAPANFLHLQQWIEAERAWALGEHWAAAASFNTAMDSAAQRSRPWHLALITERAARFHLAQGMHHTGRPLLKRATHLYEAWGASAKVSQLHEAFTDLHTGGGNAGRSGVRQRESHGRSTIVSTDMVDVMSVLRASQALSSETSLERLNDRVSKVLGAMTGAASVLLVVRTADEQGWQVFVPDGDKAQTITLDEAVAQTRLPLSAFHYAERTREPLLINEATRDERFARDPYFEGLTQCALLLLPVLSKGALRGMLVLENRISRGAFSAERLDAVSLIAGQLSVSLDNALLYASLAQKVAERTAALEEANQRLELLSATDALTGVANRRKFNEALDAEWLRARRTQSPIGLVLIDIDHFKLYNDHYGHQGGDACLQLVATTMRAGLRAGSDLIARYGGEEFVLLLPNTDLQGTLTVAERVRAAVAARAEPHLNASHGIVTVSVGITSFVPSGEAKATQYIELADQALYEAKRAGRNRVCGGATAG